LETIISRGKEAVKVMFNDDDEVENEKRAVRTKMVHSINDVILIVLFGDLISRIIIDSFDLFTKIHCGMI
jgi:hypothetical protein